MLCGEYRTFCLGEEEPDDEEVDSVEDDEYDIVSPHDVRDRDVGDLFSTSDNIRSCQALHHPKVEERT